MAEAPPALSFIDQWLVRTSGSDARGGEDAAVELAAGLGALRVYAALAPR